jgi:hypothetical protein
MEGPDFIEKYGALVHILEHGEDDLEELAAEQGYTRAAGREWRNAHCKAVLGYLRAIRTDYEVLWQQTSARAIKDAWLGTWLGDTERRLRHLQRRLRLYVVIQRIAPPPGRGELPRTVRRFVMSLLPKVSGSEVQQVLTTMRRIHQRGGASVFLP